MHGHLRLGQRAVDQALADRRPHVLLLGRPHDAEFARHAPVGKQLDLAPQQRVVVRRQRGAVAAQLPLDQRGDGVAHQRVGAGTVGLAQRGQVLGVAQVVQQQETLLQVLFEHARAVQPGAADQAADAHEGGDAVLG